MAKTSGPVQINGKLGNLVFYTLNNKNVVRFVPEFDKEELKKDPRRANTRKAAKDFGTASSGGKLIRDALSDVLEYAKDSYMIASLNKRLIEILKTDSFNHSGKRSFNKSNLHLLLNYNFNAESILTAIFKVNFETILDRNNCLAELKIPSFIPHNSMNAPAATTHYKLISSFAEINFTKKYADAEHLESDYLKFNKQPANPFSMLHRIQPKSKNLMIMCLGIRFYEHVNGQFIMLQQNKFRPYEIIAVSQISK